MKTYFSAGGVARDDDWREQVGKRLAELEGWSRYSEPDRCQCVSLRCSVCGCGFEQELGFARASVVCGLPPLCIKCEGATADVSAPRTTVFGYFATLGEG